MRKRLIPLICCAVAVLFLCSFLAGASGTVHINGAENVLDRLFSESYAIGADGTALLGTDDVSVLTASGIQTVGTESGEGGGGLVYVDGTVPAPMQVIRVALRYYYSEGRNSSVAEARLENAVGGGYEFGYLDESRAFVPYLIDVVVTPPAETDPPEETPAPADPVLPEETPSEGTAAETPEPTPEPAPEPVIVQEVARTDVRKLSMRPDGNGGVCVFDTDTDELLFSLPSTGKDRYLVVHPISPDEESVTWFSRQRYYGDFAYTDLGNGKLTVVNILPLERYLLGVCGSEMGSSFPLEALKAQAVAARTYAAFYRGGVYAQNFGFDLTCDTYCQAYGGYVDAPRIVQAVEETENQYLTYDGKLINALYFSADGGETLDSELVFPNALPYLRGYKDPYEASVWTRGPNGHCVGMSQWGAYAMASNYGKNYQEILGFYYTGVGLSYGIR